MKKFYYSLLLVFFSFTGWSQSTITGQLVDAQARPVEAATISLLRSTDRQFVKAAVADAKGNFTLRDIKTGNYQILISSLGLQDLELPLEVESKPTYNLGTLSLQAKAEELDAVTVTAEKPVVQVLADKTVFNVQSTINAAGSSGFELLRMAPGVIVDNNDNLIVEGKAGVLIFIDDKPSVLRGQDLTNYLKTIQSSDIEAIEIITQPSSKYDAEGNAGIINIKLKRDKSLGINGSMNTGFTYGEFARYNNSLSFNNRNKRTNLYGTYSNRFGKNFSFLNLFRRQNNTIFDARTETVNDDNNNNVRMGFDYYATSKSTFGVIATGNFSNGTSDSDSRTPIIPNGSTTPDQVLVAGSDTDVKTSNVYLNLNYRFKDTLGHSLNLDVDYGKFTRDRANFQPNQYFNGDETELLSETINFMVTPTDINILTAQVDYEQDFLQGKLALGVKYSKIKTENEFDFFDRINGEDVLNLDRTNDFNYDEQVNAAYFNFNKKWNSWNLQFGLRVENTNSDGQLFSAQENGNDRVKRNYTDFFPSGGITYQVNRKHSLALNYSRRIQRPNYQSLNPFEYKIDELSFRRGNPFLQPQYTDNVKLSHTYNYRLTTSISYSFIKDFFAQVTEAVGDDQNFINVRNVANQRIINLGVSYPIKFNDWWNIYFSLNAFRSSFEATNEDFVAIAQNTLSLYAQNTFSLPGGYKMEVSGWFSSPSIWGGTYRTESLGSLNVAFLKRFFNDKLTARLAFNDILYTSPWEGDTRFGTLSIDGSGGWDSRQVRLNLTYNFGSNEIKAARKRKTGIENEKSRIE